MKATKTSLPPITSLIPPNVLQKAFELFRKYGIRSVSMDDIARELGMSKKTLYQHVANKAALVKAIVLFSLYQEQDRVATIYDETQNAIDQMGGIGEFVRGHLEMLNPTTMYDLRKYYPDCWRLLEKHKAEFIYTTIAQNIENGVAQGLYRKDIRPKLIAQFYIAKLEAFLDGSYLITNHLKPVDVYNEMFKYHLFGIASVKGMEYIIQNLDKIKK